MSDAGRGIRHRLRDREPTRLDALIDGTFAFAITLLVLWNDRLPNDVESLLVLYGSIPSFAVSFALIALFWWQHVTWSRRHRVDDRVTTLLSLALVFVVLIFVFPLRILFSTFFSWITNDFLPSPFQGDIDASVLCFLFITYGIAFASLSACISGLYWRAWATRAENEPDAAGATDAAAGASVYACFVALALLSAALAALFLLLGVENVWLVTVAGWVYFLLFFTGVVEKRVRRAAARRAGI
ncbi:TMEM175 family protein [Herbiconiux daphne]|uniref:TMEM175 family protein n=1 Tax=Herbiconiux daphne TaxID=2970914 RepID=A0ABT2GZB6_9MICO|nr:TMEM175 family protein [Herbiconiux daphne]MCS5732400.1 TMEM175 family protein [Herbiconiux daphne]